MCLIEVKIRSLPETGKGKHPQEQEFSKELDQTKQCEQSSFLSPLLMLIELAGGQTAEFLKAIFLPSPDL